MESKEITSILAEKPKKQGRKFNRWLYYRNRLRFAIFRRDKFRCRYCGRTIKDGIRLSLDHVIPLIRGGGWGSDNLLTACHECNVGKAEDVLFDIEAETLKGAVLTIGWTSSRLSSCEGGVLVL